MDHTSPRCAGHDALRQPTSPLPLDDCVLMSSTGSKIVPNLTPQPLPCSWDRGGLDASPSNSSIPADACPLPPYPVGFVAQARHKGRFRTAWAARLTIGVTVPEPTSKPPTPCKGSALVWSILSKTS